MLAERIRRRASGAVLPTSGSGDLRPRLGVAIVALAPLFFFWQATLGQALFGGPADLLMYYLPARVLTGEWLASGQWPLWNPYVFSGFPHLAAGQVAVFFPGNWLFAVLAPVWAMNVQMLATYAIAGVGTYAYCRAVHCSVAAAALAGVTLTGAGFMRAHACHTTLVQAAAWLPLVLWCLEQLRQAPRLAVVAGGGAALALSVFAGHPQGGLLIFFTGAAYVVFFVLAGAAPAGRWRFLAASAAMMLVGLALSAVQMVPTAELAAQSIRARLTFDEFNSYSMVWSQVPMLLVPGLFGGDQSYPYWGAWNEAELANGIGSVPVMLAIAVLPLARRDRVVQAWVFLGGLAFLLSLGAATPLAWVAYHVPVWNLFRAPGRNALVLDFALAVLAAIGLTRAGASRPGWLVAGTWLVAGCVALTAALAATVGAAWWAPLAERRFPGGFANPVLAGALSLRAPGIALPLLLTAAAVPLLLALARRPTPWRALAVVLLQAATVAILGEESGERLVPLAQAGREAPYETFLRERASPGSERVAIVQPGSPLTTSHRPAAVHVPLLNGYDPLMLARYGEFAGNMVYGGGMSPGAVTHWPRFLDLLNAGYLVHQRTLPDYLPPTPDSIARPARTGRPLGFALPDGFPTTHVDLAATLRIPRQVADGTPVARLVVQHETGGIHAVDLRAGVEIAAAGEARTARFALPVRQMVSGLRLEVLPPADEIQVARLALVNERLRSYRPLTQLDFTLADRTRWEPVFSDALADVYRNRAVRPRAWLTPEARRLEPRQILQAVRGGTLPDGTPFDPAAVALVEDADPFPYAEPDPAARVAVTRFAPDAIELESDGRSPAFLVLSEIFYPGWRAEIDDQPVPIVRTNYVLRGVPLAPGAHRIRFTYRPLSVPIGAAVSAATLALLAGVAWQRRRAAVDRELR